MTPLAVTAITALAVLLAATLLALRNAYREADNQAEANEHLRATLTYNAQRDRTRRALLAGEADRAWGVAKMWADRARDAPRRSA